MRLTDAGAELRRRLETRLAEEHPAVTGLSPTQRETLHRLLLRLSETTSPSRASLETTRPSVELVTPGMRQEVSRCSASM